MIFFRIFQHLLPNAKAWRLTITKNLRRFFEGLTDIGGDSKQFIDEIWEDIFPETTRELSKWESQFGLSNTVIDEQERRDRLDAAWKALGGQDPTYIQETLQAAGFNVFIHEWWELPRTEPPTVHNPLDFLNDGTAPTRYVMVDGAVESNDGNPEANDGASLDPTGFALVNKDFVPAVDALSDGDIEMNDGAAFAMDGGELTQYVRNQYVVPVDPTKWPYFLYIGGQTFPDHAIVPVSRRNEFETLCLKLCPAQQWLGMLITYG
jgi:hypothetical protein